MTFIQVCWRIEGSQETHYKKHIPEFTFNYLEEPAAVVQPMFEYAKQHIHDRFAVCENKMIGDRLCENKSVNSIVQALWKHHNKLITLQFILKMMLAGGYMLCPDTWLVPSRDIFSKESTDLISMLCRSINDTEIVKGHVPKSVQVLNFRRSPTAFQRVEILSYDRGSRFGQQYWVPLQTSKGIIHIVYSTDFMPISDDDIREYMEINE